MSILNVNQIQPVGSGQTVTISAANITASSSTISASSFVGGVTVTSGNLTGISSVSTTNLTVNGNAYPATGALSNRNIIVNGGMAVSQRGTSFSHAHDGTNSGYTLDRWRVTMRNTTDQYDCTITQSSDTPVGFTSSLLITTGTAETTVDADEYYSVQYKVEGQDLQQISSGTSDAKDVTLSFWVKSSQTGTYVVSVYKADQTQRGITTTYSISSADTWEYKSVIITGDTGGGGIDSDNGLGWNLYWVLGAGSDWTSTDSTSWIDYATTGFAYGQGTNGVITNAGATWAMTGVQLEVGTVATPFEHRSYGDELARCQRYYWMIQNESFGAVCQGVLYNTNNFYSVVHFPVTMRSAPTLDVSNATDYFRIFSNASADTFDTMISNNPTVTSIELRAENTQGVGGRTAGHAAFVRTNNASAYIAVTAEL